MTRLETVGKEAPRTRAHEEIVEISMTSRIVVADELNLLDGISPDQIAGVHQNGIKEILNLTHDRIGDHAKERFADSAPGR